MWSIQIVAGRPLPVKARGESESKRLGTFVAYDFVFYKSTGPQQMGNLKNWSAPPTDVQGVQG